MSLVVMMKECKNNRNIDRRYAYGLCGNENDYCNSAKAALTK